MTEAVEERDSPKLEQFRPDLNPRPPTPPPFVHYERPSENHASKYVRKEAFSSSIRGPTIGFSQANAALLRHIAPDRPELVSSEIEIHSNVDSPRDDPSLKLPGIISEHQIKPESTKPDLKTKAVEVLNYLNYLPDASCEALPPSSRDRHQPPPLKDLLDDRIEHRAPSHNHLENEPPKSSDLRKFLITDPESKDSLPALRPPDDLNTRLPPIQTQLGQLAPGAPQTTTGPLSILLTGSYSLPPVTAVSSPPLARTETASWEPQRALAPPKIPASPYSHLSPVSSQDISAVSSPVSHPNYWRGTPKPNVRYLYDPPSTASAPATNYPTPTDQAPGSCESPYAPTPHGNGAPTSTGTFKCHHPGCTAPPFQTQYLLNSHANVHSQDRPHFCPIEGCSRGPGGKGFKRKNEMIRHGLVHNSPGYVCPFCPDQQHKYPRPDNLQR
ncbi:hypothetical protein ARAM_007724 [Aspergillus rambellii]|uniref:C2H2-type domain-containing protein n=1 Tax=Aspergillus rambellii TaxID=308745 RepID=A0A0F8WN83_9EURO|nr:hypothetical protein ARAM_007724 [Aspergillus rambellii]